jgi:predicted RNA-binding protein with PIN domain
VLIVDGYNVVGAWPKLKKFFVAGELDQAREKLMSDLGEYLHYKVVSLPVSLTVSAVASYQTPPRQLPVACSPLHRACA